MLLQPEVIDAQRAALTKLIKARLRIEVAGEPLRADLWEIVPIPEKRDLRLIFKYPWSAPSGELHRGRASFSLPPRHRTFLNIYQRGQLDRQEIFEGDRAPIEYRTGSRQSVGAVVRQFLFEGIHHIFIGPDHILFVIGLLLLGGSRVVAAGALCVTTAGAFWFFQRVMA
ncbi:MAG: HupE/UreJ family protein [Verrucomicrobiota bacterium]|nr:HupE/UreJ family protein [Verrucomicrobiota bacterium]